MSTEHRLTVTLPRVRGWAQAEQRAAALVRRYFAIPRRGWGAEPDEQVLAGAVFEVTSRHGRTTFDAQVTVTR